MVLGIALFVAKAVAWGIISYGAPRLLVALGVPLDAWIVALGALLAIRLSRQVALWGATVLVGIALYLGSFWLPAWIFPQAPTTPSVVAVAPPLRSGEPKQYTDRTARELATLFVGRTPLQAAKLLEADVGKWLKVFGEVKMIWRSNSQGDVAVILQDGPASVQCAFGSQWSDYLAKTNQGDLISVEGQILDSQIGNPLYLVKCEVD
jgi:hypothetical protein